MEDLLFDPVQEIDTTLAERFIKEHKEFQVQPEKDQCFVYDCYDSMEKCHKDINLNYFFQLTESHKGNIINHRIRKKFSEKLKENWELFCQLEYLIRNNDVEDTNEQLKLILQYLECYDALWQEGHMPYSLLIMENSPLYYLGYAIGVGYCGRVLRLYTTMKTAPLCRLFYDVCLHAGIDVYLVYINDQNVEDIAKFCRFSEPEGCTMVLTEHGDIQSAVDVFLYSSTKAPWRINRILVQEDKIGNVKAALSAYGKGRRRAADTSRPNVTEFDTRRATVAVIERCRDSVSGGERSDVDIVEGSGTASAEDGGTAGVEEGSETADAGQGCGKASEREGVGNAGEGEGSGKAGQGAGSGKAIIGEGSETADQGESNRTVSEAKGSGTADVGEGSETADVGEDNGTVGEAEGSGTADVGECGETTGVAKGSGTAGEGEGSGKANVGEGCETADLGEGNGTVGKGAGSGTADIGEGSKKTGVGKDSGTAGEGEGIGKSGEGECIGKASIEEGSESAYIGEGRVKTSVGEGGKTADVGEGNGTVGEAEGSRTADVGERGKTSGVVKDSGTAGEGEGSGKASLEQGSETANLGECNETVGEGEGSRTADVGEGSETADVGVVSESTGVVIDSGTAPRHRLVASEKASVGEGSETVGVGKGNRTVCEGEGSEKAGEGERSGKANVGEGCETADVGEGNGTVDKGAGNGPSDIEECSKTTGVGKDNGTAGEGEGIGKACEGEGIGKAGEGDGIGNASVGEFSGTRVGHEYSVVEVTTFRSIQELKCLLETSPARFLSLWCAESAPAHLLAAAAMSRYVWLDDYASFDGPPEVALAIFTDGWYHTFIDGHSQPAPACLPQQAWSTLKLEERKSRVLKAIDKCLSEFKPSNAESFTQTYQSIANYNSHDLVEVQSDKIIYIVDCPGQVICLHTSILYVLKLLVRGYSVVTNFFTRIEKCIMYGLIQDEIPITTIFAVKSLRPIKLHHSNEKVIRSKHGTMFAN